MDPSLCLYERTEAPSSEKGEGALKLWSFVHFPVDIGDGFRILCVDMGGLLVASYLGVNCAG